MSIFQRIQIGIKYTQPMLINQDNQLIYIDFIWNKTEIVIRPFVKHKLSCPFSKPGR